MSGFTFLSPDLHLCPGLAHNSLRARHQMMQQLAALFPTVKEIEAELA